MSEDLRAEFGGEIEQSVETEKAPFSAIIVFGHGYSDRTGNLSWEAKARAIGAHQLWKAGLAPVIVTTGADPSENNRKRVGVPDLKSNAELMRDYLTRHFDIPEEAILLEDRSQPIKPGSLKTVDNVGLAVNSLEEKGYSSDNFITVSTGFHMDRISKIMEKYGLKSQPVSAESALSLRSQEHADKMLEREKASGMISESEMQKRYLERRGKYDRMLERIKLSDPVFQQELKDEPKWQEAMNNWGYWGPLALAVKGDKLKELISTHREEIEAWLKRHPDLEVSIEDLIVGNFNYRDLVEKAREIPN